MNAHHATAKTHIELTPGQYNSLIRLTRPHHCQTPRTVSLRHALELAQLKGANNRYVTQLTSEQITSAAYILGVAALRGGAAPLQARNFRHQYLGKVVAVLRIL